MGGITELSFLIKVLERRGYRHSVAKHLHALSRAHKAAAVGLSIGHPRRDYHAQAADDCSALADLYKNAEHPYIDREESWHDMVPWHSPMRGGDVSISSPAGLCSEF